MQNQPVGVVLRLPFKYFLKTHLKERCGMEEWKEWAVVAILAIILVSLLT